MTNSKKEQEIRIIIISDGTGETATSVAKAALIQFKQPKNVYYTRYNNVRSTQQLESIMEEAAIHNDLVVYTLVNSEHRETVLKLAKQHGVIIVDVLGPILNVFASYLESSPKSEPGLFHQINENYFQRIDAIEFTIAHDDGKKYDDLENADIIILGVSRTSKTPLSMFLSTKGWRVVNIPIVKEIPVPDEVLKADPKKVIGLTIDPERLAEIRKERLTRLGQEAPGSYADLDHVLGELEYANQLFSKNRKWPIFNVTGKALEETAAEISKLFTKRFKRNPRA